MKVHLINPSNVAFGTAVITPRWLYVLAAATPLSYGTPNLVDETLATTNPLTIHAGDVVGIGIHTGNALRGYEIGKMARQRGAYVVFGGIHATLYPEESAELGGAHAVVKGDGDVVWTRVLEHCTQGKPEPLYVGGRIEGSEFLPARWDLLPPNSYMWASVQTIRGCPKHCSFCSVWFELMARLAQLPSDTVFFTQITMEAAEDAEFLAAMKAAHIHGALVGVEAVTPEGLKDVYKDFNLAGQNLVDRLRKFRRHDIHILGSFIFGLPSDRPNTFAATAAVAEQSELTFAQFVMLTPFPGTVDFARWEQTMVDDPTRIAGVPLTRGWLIPQAIRPKLFWTHPVMSAEEIRKRTQDVWDRFYSIRVIWKRSSFLRSMKGRLAFILISKLYRRMYADTGIATDSARVAWSTRWARWLAKPTRRLFAGRPMPNLQVPPAVEVSS